MRFSELKKRLEDLLCVLQGAADLEPHKGHAQDLIFNASPALKKQELGWEVMSSLTNFELWQLWFLSHFKSPQITPFGVLSIS